VSYFSATYKKIFKPFLLQQGFTAGKRIFYKEADENMCFIVDAMKDRNTQRIEMGIDTVPYCEDLKEEEFDPREIVYNLIGIYKILFPDMFIHIDERSHNFYLNRFLAVDDAVTLNSLSTIKNDMEESILPYIHRFTDLDYCYDELIKQRQFHRSTSLEECLTDFRLYSLSIKLHKYENAFPYIDFQLERHTHIIETRERDLIQMRKGSLAGVIGRGFDQESQDQLIKSLLRKRPNYIEEVIPIKEEMIRTSKNVMQRLQTIREALESKDNIYLDRLVDETEKRSREYIKEMLTGTK
jgi:hypothetical protein